MDAPPSATADPTAAHQFRRELRRLRVRSGMTQRALADRVRFSRETVAAVESGRRYGSRELAVRCDEVLATGGLLASLWPQVAAEQLAADGRRGPRTADPPQVSAGPYPPEPAKESGDVIRRPDTVAAAIDELRALVDRMLTVHLIIDHHHAPPPVLRRGRADTLGPRR